MPVQVEERDIYVTTGNNSQTIKICGPQNIRGEYEYFFRIRPPRFGQEELVTELERRAVRGDTIDQVIIWMNELNALDESHSSVGTSDATIGEELPPLAPPINITTSQAWLDPAIESVEDAIKILVTEFVKSPLLHRVEHCLHTQLVQLLRQQQFLTEKDFLGETGLQTQLVHKEWPETIPRPGRRGRGNFDVVVLSPELIRACSDRLAFLEGRLAAPIAIEVGLDYRFSHLNGDLEKLRNSQVPMGYVIHFVRNHSPTQQELDLLNGNGDGNIRTACVFSSADHIWIKHTSDIEVRQVQ